MKISNVGPGKPVSKSKKKDAAAKSSEFSSHLDKPAGPSHGGSEISEIVPVASVDNILAIQEVGDATDQEGRRVVYERGEDILDRLAEIQRDILSGGISKERLQNLAQLLRKKREAIDDPQLEQIIGEIELRAEVEIAKWTRST